MNQDDKDLDRILRLVNTIQCYERLVEYVLTHRDNDVTLSEAIRTIVADRYDYFNQNKSQTARSLDISKPTLRRYLINDNRVTRIRNDENKTEKKK